MNFSDSLTTVLWGDNSRRQVAPCEETVGVARQKVGSRFEYHIRLGIYS